MMFPSSLSWSTPSLVTVVVGLVSALYFGLTYYVQVRKHRKQFETIPTPPNAHWLLGHISSLGGDFRIGQPRLTRDYCNKYGQTALWVVSSKMITVTSVDDARTVLNGSNYRKPVSMLQVHINKFLGPQNIGFLSGKEWKFHRSSILRAFTPAALNEAQPEILKVMSVLIASLKERGNRNEGIQRDIGALMKMITMDVFGQTALSRDLDCCSKLQPSSLAVAFDYLGEELSRRMFKPSSVADFFYWIPTTQNLRHGRERKLLQGFLGDLVRERLAMPKDNRPKDLLNGILLGMEEGKGIIDSSHLSESTSSDVLLSFLLFASYDTTSILLTYALYHIATFPDVEKTCLAEVAQADVTNRDALPYCKGIILETLRLYPPVIGTLRTLDKPWALSGGLTLPPDTSTMIPIWTIHRMEEHFERPAEFRPDRWAYQDEDGVWKERFENDTVTSPSAGGDTDGIAPANRKAFLAFSGGARSCAGTKFAMTEAVLVFAQLVKHFSFELPPDYELVPVRFGLVQRPRDVMIMTMKLRE
ncbi:cytochrome p450 [Fragilaria crotonensis]|nr:cytochrome p450 [Fragilaria crotonensis]